MAHNASGERHRLTDQEAFAIHAAAATRDYALKPRLGEDPGDLGHRRPTALDARCMA